MLYLILLLILAAIALGGAWYGYRVSFYSPKKNREKIPETSGEQYDPYRPEMKRIFHQLNDRPHTIVTVTSYDNLTLSGRYYHIADNAPLDICFHGYRSSYLTDFSGGSELSAQMGHNLLLVDQRAHGKSQGMTISFGIRERMDVLTWVDWALDKFGGDLKIMLYGISMGGATVLMASNLPLPENVKGIVADCPYSSAKDIICTVAGKVGYPPKLTWPFVKLGAKIFGGFDPEEMTAAEAVEDAQVPILIIHGEADTFVPCSMSDIVSHNPERIRRVTVPGADHGISYLVNKELYQTEVTDFVSRVM